MKIVLVCYRFPPAIGGVENYAYHISRELSKRHEINVLTSDMTKRSLFRISRTKAGHERIANDFNVYRFKTYPPDVPYIRAYGMIPHLVKYFLTSNPDIVNIQSHMLIHSDAVSLLSMIRKLPSVLTVHTFGDTAPGPYLGVPMKLYMRTIGKMSLKLVSRIIVLTPNAIKYFSQLGIDEEKIRIVPGGIEYDHYLNMPPPSIFKKNYAINGEVILFVGQILPRKNIDALIKALPRILQDVPSTKLVIVGPDCGSQKQLEKLSGELGVRDKVLFTGTLIGEELLQAYSACDVFVLPSDREGLPLVILEALASGKPVIATEVGGVVSVVKDGVTGFLTRYGDDRELAHLIIKLLLDENLSGEMGEEGRKVAKNYDWSAISKKTEDVYQEARSLIRRET